MGRYGFEWDGCEYNELRAWLCKEKEKEEMAKSKGGGKVHKVMHEFKHGELHSGSKKGPVVKKRKQAIAIALSEAGLSRKK